MRAGDDKVSRGYRVWVALVLTVGVAAMLWVAAPRVAAMIRHKTPPSPAMREASAELDPFAASGPAPEVPLNPNTDRERLLLAAYAMRGIPYKYGAKGPDKLDCSGFTKKAYDAIGVKLPDGSFNQAAGERPLASLDQLTPGDLLFYRWYGEKGVTHVTMYAGNGWAIGTGSPGQKPWVVVYPLASDLRVEGTVITYRHIVLDDEG